MTSPKQSFSINQKILIGAGLTCGCLTVGIIPLAIFATIFLPSLSPKQFPKAKEAKAKQYLMTHHPRTLR